MKAKANMSLKFSSKKQLDAIVNGLLPEANSPINRRSKISLTRQGLMLTLNVEADDTVALRAALNAYLRWINSIIDVVKQVENC